MADANRNSVFPDWWQAALALLVIQITFASCVLADEVSGEAGESLACLDAQRFQAGWTHTMELRSWDRIGSEKVLIADVAVMPPTDGNARFLAYFRKPDDIRAVRMLANVSRESNEILVYLPILFKVRKITGRQLSNSVHGTDFSYEDLEWLLGMMERRQPPRITQEDIGGRHFYKFEIVPDPEQKSHYERLVSYVDRDSCVLHRVDMFGHGNRKAKVLTVDESSIQEIGGVRLPRIYTMEDLREETRTQLTISDIRLDRSLPETAFTADKLKEFRGFF